MKTDSTAPVKIKHEEQSVPSKSRTKNPRRLTRNEEKARKKIQKNPMDPIEIKSEDSFSYENQRKPSRKGIKIREKIKQDHTLEGKSEDSENQQREESPLPKEYVFRDVTIREDENDGWIAHGLWEGESIYYSNIPIGCLKLEG